MDKKLDLNKNVHDLVKKYPELINILADLGFKEITKKAMLNSVGRIITIPKGADVRGVDLNNILSKLEENGFVILNNPNIESKVKVIKVEENNTTKLKSYLDRLNQGEDLEVVRAEFVENFNDVEASEIMKAEQELLAEGVPLNEMQRLCDIHSALFHGTTREEKIANAELAVAKSLSKIEKDKQNLIDIKGHPLNTLAKENDSLEKILKSLSEKINNKEDILDDLKKAQEAVIHYKKKGDLLYPTLKVKYDISGPHTVMWTVDDEIRDDISRLIKKYSDSDKNFEKAQDIVNRMEEMIYKENNILFPILTENFTTEDWKDVYRDSKDYSECLGVVKEVWEEGENNEDQKEITITDSIITMPGGNLTVEQLTPMLNTLPVEITFIDENNINQYFNEGPKVFKRPEAAIGREVFDCHPPKVEKMVRNIIEDFRNNKRDSIPIWMEREGKPFLVTYMAVRDKDGNYKGTLETVQDMSVAKEHFVKES